MIGYSDEVELKMQRLFERLSEKDRRCYAAIEVAKLDRGGLEYISKLFKIDPKTIRRGMTELELSEDPAPNWVRKKGADAKL